MKSINTSLFDFPTLRDPQPDYVYVDKTAQLYEIAKPTADRIYYLPRPRRFGKSLMLSTLKALFEGRRELFKGLAIEKTDWDWEKEVYPVLHLDMSTVASKTNAELEVSLQDLVQGLGARFGAPFDPAKPAKMNFKNVLVHLAGVSPNGKYVVLIDEYLDEEFVTLKIPNHEVETSLYRGHMAQVLGKDFEIDGFTRNAQKSAKALVAEGVGEKFVTFLRAGFSKLPHDWAAKDEREVKRAFAAFMAFTGAKIYGESQQANGRPDAVLETEKGVYIFEFNFDKTPEAALAQCREKDYAAPYAADPRPVRYVALNYNPTARTLDDPLAERVK